MTRTEEFPRFTRFTAALLLCLPISLLAGCSQDYASVDDVYVPASAEERFPIQVQDRPVKLNLPAYSGKLPPEDVNRLASFARAAKDDKSSPVSVRYPSGSSKAKSVAQQAVRVLVSQGVHRSMIHTVGYKGKSDVVSLSITRRIAATKQCGDWSENLKGNQYNEPFPNYGCSLQNNVAAMVANPEDFEGFRPMGPAYAAGRMGAMESYNSGEWLQPQDAPGVSELGQ